MLAISRREFIETFKGIKPIIIISIFLITAYYSGKFTDLILSLEGDNGFSSQEIEVLPNYTISVLIMFFGTLFVMGLSHDTMNREIHEQTIRFLVTRTSRSTIIIGKFLGIWFFWIVCLVASFLVISVFVHKFDVIVLLQTISLLGYFIALTILLSVLIPKPGFTMFLSIVLGIAFPVFNFWILLTTNPSISWIKYLFPFYYLDNRNFNFIAVLLLSGAILIIAIAIFKRREC